MEEIVAGGENCIIRKVLSNTVVMKNVFSKIWKLSGDFTISEVGEKNFLFRFEQLVEKERMLYPQS